MSASGLPQTVLYVDHTAKLGGGEIALLNLIGALDRSRFRPFVILSEPGPLVEKLQEIRCECEVLPLDKKLGDARKDSLGSASARQRVRQVSGALAYAVRLAAVARREKARIIHANSLKADIFGGIAGRLAGIPVIWHVRDHVNAEYLPRRVAALFRGLAAWLPTVAVAISGSVLRELGGERAVSDSAGLDYTEASRSRLSHYQLIYDGCKPGDAQRSDAAEEALGALPIVALVGRIAEWKGQHVFIDAAAQVLRSGLKARFWIVGAPLFGEHDYEARIRRQVCDLGIGEAVEFLGFRGDVPALLRRSALVVHASTLGEPFGQVVIEAMAAAKPVVATGGGAIPEIVVDGETGLLVPRADAAALAGAIRFLLLDPSRRLQMGQAGRRRAVECFDVRRTARKAEALYTALLDPSFRNGASRNGE